MLTVRKMKIIKDQEEWKIMKKMIKKIKMVKMIKLVGILGSTFTP